MFPLCYLDALFYCQELAFMVDEAKICCNGLTVARLNG